MPQDVLKQIEKEQLPVLSDDKRADAIEGFDKLPQQIKDMMARSVGMKDGSNATAVVEKLMDENRLYEGDDDEQFSMVAKADDFEDIFVDMEMAEVNAFVRNLLPEVTRKEGRGRGIRRKQLAHASVAQDEVGRHGPQRSRVELLEGCRH